MTPYDPQSHREWNSGLIAQAFQRGCREDADLGAKPHPLMDGAPNNLSAWRNVKTLEDKGSATLTESGSCLKMVLKPALNLLLHGGYKTPYRAGSNPAALIPERP